LKITDILLIGGGVFAVYKLTEKVSEDGEDGSQKFPSFGGGGTSIDLSNLFGGLGNLFGGDGISGSLPDMNGLIDNTIPSEMGDWLDEFRDIINNIPSEVPTIMSPEIPSIVDNLIPTFPNPATGWNEFVSEFTDITLPTNKQARDIISRGGFLYGKQIGGAMLTGHHVLRPLPFAKVAEVSTVGLRAGAKTISQRAIPKVAESLFTQAAKGGVKVISHGASDLAMDAAMKIAGRGIGKTVLRATPKVAVSTLKVGARAIPFVGWALLAGDLVADAVRVFGVDVPEWLGFSGLVSAFTGENPIEKWASQSEQELSAFNPNIDSERGTGYSYSPELALADPAGTLARKEAATGQPELPSLSADAIEAGFKYRGTMNTIPFVSKRDLKEYSLEELQGG